MDFPKTLHAKGWHGDLSPRDRRRLLTAGGVLAFALLLAYAGVAALGDGRPLNQQFNSAMQRAGETLRHREDPLPHGLQVSLRAVADGNERPAGLMGQAAPIVRSALQPAGAERATPAASGR